MLGAGTGTHITSPYFDRSIQLVGARVTRIKSNLGFRAENECGVDPGSDL